MQNSIPIPNVDSGLYTDDLWHVHVPSLIGERFGGGGMRCRINSRPDGNSDQYIHGIHIQIHVMLNNCTLTVCGIGIWLCLVEKPNVRPCAFPCPKHVLHTMSCARHEYIHVYQMNVSATPMYRQNNKHLELYTNKACMYVVRYALSLIDIALQMYRY